MAKKDDIEFLKQYVAEQGVSEAGNPGAAMRRLQAKQKGESAVQYLEELTADEPASGQPSTARQERLQRRSGKAGAADPERQQRLAAREEQARIDAIELQRSEQAGDINSRIQRGVSTASGAIQPAIDRVSAWPTIGGIGLLLALLAILLFLVVRVNDSGDTRAKQMWYMLNGRASLQGSVKPSGVANSTDTTVIPGGASGNFGPAASTDTSTTNSYHDTSMLGF